jgi:primosomal protein N' (replication factor Y)
MIWESLWRGMNPLERKVLIQSRAPGRGWQAALKTGWGQFWDRELQERQELELPPYAALVQIQAPGKKLQVLKKALEQQELLVLEPLEGGDEIWVQSNKMGKIYRTLAPFMEIGKPLGCFPLLRTWLD